MSQDLEEKDYSKSKLQARAAAYGTKAVVWTSIKATISWWDHYLKVVKMTYDHMNEIYIWKSTIINM